MDHNASLIRAIAAEFARRKAIGFAIPFGVAITVIAAIGVWLVSISKLWLLLVVPLDIVLTLSAVLFGVAYALIRRLRPAMPRHLRADVREFVDKFERATGAAQTPLPFVIAHVIFDAIMHRSPNFIEQFVDDSTTLKADYAALARKFERKWV